ncbi:unnamed protein product [Vicia faba]|uniref:Uncharacterized protein n=1 Tax=Vicia faba TaxID=3906 RepID=A0AAV1AR11_VICFA|nr:unnamed protein product [Vicia faba]
MSSSTVPLITSSQAKTARHHNLHFLHNINTTSPPSIQQQQIQTTNSFKSLVSTIWLQSRQSVSGRKLEYTLDRSLIGQYRCFKFFISLSFHRVLAFRFRIGILFLYAEMIKKNGKTIRIEEDNTVE